MQLTISEIRRRIYFMRGQRVMLDVDLAKFYEISTKRLNEQVKRNISRFPEDFRFRLTENECDELNSQFPISSTEHGGRRYLPYIFTEHGATMLASVLNTDRAIQVNVTIVRAFVQIRESSIQKELALKVMTLEKQYTEVSKVISDVHLKLMALTSLQKTNSFKTRYNKADLKEQEHVSLDTKLETLTLVTKEAKRDFNNANAINEVPHNLIIGEIQKAVARYYNVKIQDLRSTTRIKVIALARQIAMYLVRKHTGMSFKDIGTHFGGKDHTTIMHACSKVEVSIKIDASIRNAIESIEGVLSKNI